MHFYHSLVQKDILPREICYVSYPSVAYRTKKTFKVAWSAFNAQVHYQARHM